MKNVTRAYLDRIEGNIAVLYLGEDEADKVDIPLQYLPKDVKEGDAFSIAITKDKSNLKVGKEVEDLRKKLLENS
jgi:hypothetical protein